MPQYVAQKGKAASPQVEAMGAALGPMISNIRAEEVRMVLKEYGVEDIDLQQWYPQQLLLDIFRAVEGQYGEFSENLVAIGIQAIDAFAFPDSVTDIEAVIQFLQGVYQMTHRNHPAEESWLCHKVGENAYDITANMPYPDASSYGYLYGLARRFAPKGMRASVSSPIQEEGKPTRFEVRFVG
ncbi:MAG: hypothetical protein MUC99_11635 [Anaerolineae bacterium]|nr:hypothetical protein [Anaerolineae bacterium]